MSTPWYPKSRTDDYYIMITSYNDNFIIILKKIVARQSALRAVDLSILYNFVSSPQLEDARLRVSHSPLRKRLQIKSKKETAR